MKTTLAERMALALAGPPKKTQRALAAACGVKPPSVNGWVTGESKAIGGVNLMRAAAFLGVSPKWLAEGVGPMRDEASPPTHISPSTPSKPTSAKRGRQANDPEWPFTEIDREKLCSLKGKQAVQMQFAIKGAAASMGINIAPDRTNADDVQQK